MQYMYWGELRETCSLCNGKGRIEGSARITEYADYTDYVSRTSSCYYCKGKGYVVVKTKAQLAAENTSSAPPKKATKSEPAKPVKATSKTAPTAPPSKAGVRFLSMILGLVVGLVLAENLPAAMPEQVKLGTVGAVGVLFAVYYKQIFGFILSLMVLAGGAMVLIGWLSK